MCYLALCGRIMFALFLFAFNSFAQMAFLIPALAAWGGVSLFKRAKKAYDRMDDVPHGVASFLQQTGGITINKIVVVREPLSAFYNLAIRSLPGSNIPPDKVLYHLYCYLHLSDGTIYRTEKDETVKVGNPTNQDKTTTLNQDNIRILYARVGEKPTTVSELFENGIRNAKATGQSFWQYHPLNSNCQRYLEQLLRGSRFGGSDAGLNAVIDWFLQPEVLDYFEPNTAGFMTAITNVANYFKRITGFAGGAYVQLIPHSRGFRLSKRDTARVRDVQKALIRGIKDRQSSVKAAASYGKKHRARAIEGRRMLSEGRCGCPRGRCRCLVPYSY